MAKHRYVKANDPAQFAYFSDESVKKYDPAKAGWVKEATAEHPAPLDVINFMKEKKEEVKPEAVELNDYSIVPTSKLQEMFLTASEDDLLNVIKKDTRATAVKYAEKEIKRREI